MQITPNDDQIIFMEFLLDISFKLKVKKNYPIKYDLILLLVEYKGFLEIRNISITEQYELICNH